MYHVHKLQWACVKLGFINPDFVTSPHSFDVGHLESSVSCEKYCQAEDTIDNTLAGISSLRAWGGSALLNLEIRSICFPFLTPKSAERGDMGESFLMGTWGRREDGALCICLW